MRHTLQIQCVCNTVTESQSSHISVPFSKSNLKLVKITMFNIGFEKSQKNMAVALKQCKFDSMVVKPKCGCEAMIFSIWNVCTVQIWETVRKVKTEFIDFCLFFKNEAWEHMYHSFCCFWQLLKNSKRCRHDISANVQIEKNLSTQLQISKKETVSKHLQNSQFILL